MPSYVFLTLSTVIALSALSSDPGAKLLNFAAQTVPEDNEDKAEGAVDNFVWNDHFPSFEDYDFDTLALLEDIEDDSEFSYSFEFVNSPTTPLSLSYEF